MGLINITLRTTGEDPDVPVVPDDPVVPDVPVVPDDPVVPGEPSGEPQANNETSLPVPNTGEYSREKSLQLTPLFIGSIIIVLIIVLTIIARKLKNNHKVFARNKSFSIGAKKQKIFAGFFVLIAAFLTHGILNSDVSRTEPTNALPGSIAISAGNVDLNITRTGDEAVFGFVKDEVTVIDGTDNGYTMGVYATSVDVISEESEENKITNITSSNSALEPNTWGISVNSPENQNSEVWNAMPKNQDDALILKSIDSRTEAYDTTDVYYGAYVGADLPDGVYSGVTVNYFAVANVVIPDVFTLSFNSNNGSGALRAQECTVTESAESCSVTVPSTMPTRSGHTFKGWADTSTATTPKYQPGGTVELRANKTIYAVWSQNTVTRTLSFDANGGTGAPSAQSCVAKGTVTTCSIVITSTVPSRSGYTFLGWGDAADATTSEYEAGETIVLNSDKTIYAVWKKEQTVSTFKLSFNANGGTGAPSAQSCTTTASSCSVTVPSTKPTRTNYTFKGWATTTSASAAKYNPGDSVALSKNTTIYAVWKNNYTIKFNGNGSTSGSMSNLAMVYGTAKNLTANTFVKTGYTFSGWNTKADGSGTAYANKQSVNNLTNTAGGIINLYAQWKGQSGKIHFISTGNSNAFLIESNGHYGLVDAANPLYPANSSDVTTCMSDATCVSNSADTVSHVVTYLKKVGVTTLDFIVASHSHSDHIGGMAKIAKEGFVNSKTQYYYRPYVGAKEDTYTGQNSWHNRDFYNRAINAMRSAGAKLINVTNKVTELSLGDFSLTILNAEEATASEKVNGVCEDENVNSLVVLAKVGSKKTLLAGDMEKLDEDKVAKKVGVVDILQMGHHGLPTSTSVDFLKVIKPKTAIIPSRDFSSSNRQWGGMAYAHKNLGTKFYMTGHTSDAIIVTFNNNTYSLSDYGKTSTSTKISITTESSGKGEWVKFDFKNNNIFWSHLDSNGAVSEGWRQLDYHGRTDWYYFDGDGRMMKDEWREIEYQGKIEWFYFDSSGRMVTGSRTINGESFGFRSDGVCNSGRGCPHP